MRDWTGPAALERLWRQYELTLGIQERSAKTIEAYRYAFNQFWSWASDPEHNDPPLEHPRDVTHLDVNAWTAYQQGRAQRARGRDYLTPPKQEKLSQGTVAINWRNARPFFTWWASENDTLSPFRAGKATRPAEGEKEIPEITVEDVNRLIEVCQPHKRRGKAKRPQTFHDARDEAIFRTLFDVGPRSGEVLAMDLDCWNSAARQVTLTGKTGTRVVVVSKTTALAIEVYLHWRDELAPKTEAFWIGLKNGSLPTRLTYTGMRLMARRRCQEAGMMKLWFHLLRYAWADNFIDSDGDTELMRILGGWSKTSPMPAHYAARALGRKARRTQDGMALGDKLK